jgi:pimeloyl-ACP methyl ester carboxylesterase
MLLIACLGSASPSYAQTLAGTWQATNGTVQRVLKVTQAPRGVLHGELYYVGQEAGTNTRNGNPISSIQLQSREVHFHLDDFPGAFDGNLAADGKSLVGNWTGFGERKFPLKFERATEKTAWVIDPSPHKTRFVTIEPGVRLEALDWGGEGPPLVFLAGAGNTAHVFDAFAQKFTGAHHVYGITRRGIGLSSKPEPNDNNYDADRLGDDVLAAFEALKLDHPVIAGHSLGGEELSSIGTRHPERVSGLIYLDATAGFAFYSPNPPYDSMALYPDQSIMRRDILQMIEASASERKILVEHMQAIMPRLQAEAEWSADEAEFFGILPFGHTLSERIQQYILMSMRRYTDIKSPVLAIVAGHPCNAQCDSAVMKGEAARGAAQADAFQAGVPQARVVRLPQAEHYVFLSNEADVIREMNAFMDGLH